MAIKKKGGGGGGANWMDTYGDMVTLLLCFFVLLYSMSTIDEAKWKAIVQSFNPAGIPTNMEEIEGGTGPSADADEGGGVFTDPATAEAQEEIDQMLEALAQAISDMVAEEGMESAIQVELENGKVYIHFSDSVFFLPDDFRLQPVGQQVLAKICPLLDDAEEAIDEIRIQGHTAQARVNQANEPRGDYSLAANRAISVMIFLQENSSIHPARMVPEAYGQWRPISSNATAEGRIPNRRVEMIISGVDLDAEALNEAIQGYITQSNEDLGVSGDPVQ